MLIVLKRLAEELKTITKRLITVCPASRITEKLPKRDLKTLFLDATSKTHFMFDGVFYDQVDGVAMGSPLGPTLANLFMAHNEQRWIDEY